MVMPALIETLETDDNTSVLLEVVLALKKIGPEAKTAVPALIRIMDENNLSPICHRASEAIVQIRPETGKVVPSMVRILEKHEDFKVRLHAMQILQFVAGKDAIEPLVWVMRNNTDKKVRSAAEKALLQIDSAGSWRPHL
jgi:HEAT repeat protein